MGGTAPDRTGRKITALLLFCACAGIGLIVFVDYLVAPAPLAYSGQMEEAARLMEKCSGLIRDLREERGLPADRRYDINGTGLIGEEITSITTTLGSLEAKRTITNPGFAALMVRLYHEAGLEPGDTLALGASGSFPGAVIAALCAARVMDLEVAAVFSLGASNWGANIPELTILDMYQAVEPLLPVKAAAVSLGGLRDTGSDLGLDLIDGGREYLLEKLRRAPYPFILEPSLEEAVARRMEFYGSHGETGGTGGIKAFVNIGGADANIGEGLWSLELRPGINLPGKPAERPLADGGAVSAFLDRGVPVIHILNIKNLAVSYGLAYDPFPLPAIGTEGVYFHNASGNRRTALLAGGGLYLVLTAGILVYIKRKGRIPRA